MADIKAMRPQPTKNIRLVLTALCIMLGVPPARVADPQTAQMKDDYFEPAKKHILSNPRLFQQLRQFSAKANQIKPEILRKIRQFIAMPEFDLAKLKVQSRAAHTLASWIYAIENYDRQYKIVKPKQDALEASRKNSEVVKAALDVARADLQKVEERMKKLHADLKTMKDKKEELERRTVQCEKRKGRAEKLLSRLGGANESWVTRSAELGAKYTTVTGDCLVSSGIIAYLGAFSAPFRTACVARWVAQCKALGVSCSEGYGIVKTLGDPVTIRRWQLDGLPADQFSIENAIIMQKTISLQRRWPLCIDPQRQANAWIKKLERRENQEHQIVVLRLSEGNSNEFGAAASGASSIASRLQNAISSGLPTLLEDVRLPHSLPCLCFLPDFC
jgi:dynein heavy chain